MPAFGGLIRDDTKENANLYHFFTKMTKKQLLQELSGEGVLRDQHLKRAFERVDRADFVLPQYLEAAYFNRPLPIGFGQTISQPFTVAFMLDLLDVKRGEKVLEIGAGSGWQTALLASLVGRRGKVVAMERIGPLIDFAKSNLSHYPLLYCTSALMQGDGSLGFVKEAPFDKIIAAASARAIPKAWKDQLKIGGRIVAPVKDSIMVIDKISRDKYQQTEHWGFTFVPLIG